MMTGLYPGGHGVHENARYLGASVPVAAERLQQAGYRTAAFVSSFVLVATLRSGARVRRLRRSRSARRTNGRHARRPTRRSPTWRSAARQAALPLGPLLRRALSLRAAGAVSQPLREASVSRRESRRWTSRSAAWCRPSSSSAPGPVAIVIVADHGEGLGEHGEAQHGDLLYQSTMHVPLVIVGPGVDRRRDRHAGQHAPDLSHAPRLGGRGCRAQPARPTTPARSCSAKR